MKPSTIIPSRLRKGDTIGIAAPSSPFDTKRFSSGVDKLKAMGFEVKIPESIFQRNGYLAGSDRQRADLLTKLLLDPEIKAVICARGGYGSTRILDLLDYSAIAGHPKIFMGFSDITALLNTLQARCNWVTFHGPTMTLLGSSPLKTLDSFSAALMADRFYRIEAKSGRTLVSGTTTGPVCGGNLTVLSHLVGTPYAPDLGGAILFIEDKGEVGYRIDRMLTQIKQAGLLEGIAGLVLGDFIDCGDVEEVHQIVLDLFAGRGIPILAGLPAGHGRDNRVLPIGAEAVFDADNKTLEYTGAVTRL